MGGRGACSFRCCAWKRAVFLDRGSGVCANPFRLQRCATPAVHLGYGINLSEWFAQVYDAKGYTKEHFDA